MNTLRITLLALLLAFGCQPEAAPPAQQKETKAPASSSNETTSPSAFQDPIDYPEDEPEDEDEKKKKKKKKKDDDEDEDDKYDCEWVTKKVRECMEEDDSLWDFQSGECSSVPLASFDCTRSEVRSKLKEINISGTIPSGKLLACGEKDDGTTIIVQVCQDRGIYTSCYRGYRDDGTTTDTGGTGGDTTGWLDAIQGILGQIGQGQFQLLGDDEDDEEIEWVGGTGSAQSCF